ncbi:hypothetical protein MNBD_ALPHA01-584 [hydrothermal vent metagenome]|uniref:Uncharacterized protein n=1 Tax=hydrothermal vent metagenome TaxID=652676 RepID=A0A3B0RV71_9ZZZZ
MISVLLFSSIIALNYFTDPYLLHGIKRINGFNKIKPAAGSHSSQSKIHLAHKADINLLIIGNSRPEMGIDPDHFFFKKNNLKAYNLAQPGSTLNTQYGYAMDILREKNIKIILIAVDFIDFLTPKKTMSDPYQWPPQKTSANKRQKFNWDGSVNTDYRYQYFKDIYLPLISLDTLQDSLRTLFNQRDNSSDLLNNGFNPAKDMEQITHTDGVKTLFKQKIPQVITSFTSQDWKTNTPGYNWSPDFNKLQFLLDYLQDKGIETKVFINPYHMQYLEIIENSGLSEEFAIWKKQLVRIVANTGKDGKITLWNFSDPDNYITEPMLNAGQIPLKWFWEPAHYRKELGNLMINTLFADHKPSMKNPKQFGYRLTPENIDFYLSEYTRNLKKYRDIYPEEATFIKLEFLQQTK